MKHTEEQLNNSKNHLKPWQFKPGKSGNPGGRPKGSISLKQYAKNMFIRMSDKEKLQFIKGLSREFVWKMAEGGPDQRSAINVSENEPIFNEEHKKRVNSVLNRFLKKRKCNNRHL